MTRTRAATQRISELEAENERLRDALTFYADQGVYVPAGIAPTIWRDNGQRARDAIAMSRKDPS